MDATKKTDKSKYLSKLEKLDEKVLKRLAELSENKNALKYFTNDILYQTLKVFIKQ